MADENDLTEAIAENAGVPVVGEAGGTAAFPNAGRLRSAGLEEPDRPNAVGRRLGRMGMASAANAASAAI